MAPLQFTNWDLTDDDDSDSLAFAYVVTRMKLRSLGRPAKGNASQAYGEAQHPAITVPARRFRADSWCWKGIDEGIC